MVKQRISYIDPADIADVEMRNELKDVEQGELQDQKVK